jgi:hypothetical protein
MNPAYTSLIRGLAKLLAGAFVGFGVFDASMALQVEEQINIMLDAGAAVVGGGLFIWASYASYKAKQPASPEAKAIAVAVVEEKLMPVQAAGVVEKIEEPDEAPT